MGKQILDRYPRTQDNRLVIDIAVEKIGDFYNDMDRSAPHIKKDLDRELVDYLIDSVSEIGKESFVIQFSLASSADVSLTSRVKTSIHNYFLYLKELELRELARMGRTSLILFFIGIVILSLSVWINQQYPSHETVLAYLFTEGLTVAAWVSLWNAIATFLVNWAPHRRQIKMYERIANAEISFHDAAESGQ